MFFLMHLINKPDTEYTGFIICLYCFDYIVRVYIIKIFSGQETFVWNMYQQRCWDFFPVGDCFRKQYEDVMGE